MKTTRHFLTGLLGLALTSSVALASMVTLEVGPTVSADFTNADTTGTMSFTTAAANNSILVVTTAAKGFGANNVADDSVTAISFNGQQFSRLVGGNETHREVQIWALDLGNTGVVNDTISATLGSAGLGTRYASLTAYQISNATLSGVLTSGSGNASTTSLSADLTGVSSGAFVVDIVLENYNNQLPSLTAGGNARSGTSGMQPVPDALSGGFWSESSFITNAPAGNVDISYSIAGPTNQRMAIASAAFAAIPEPSTAALLLVAGLLLARKFRKPRG